MSSYMVFQTVPICHLKLLLTIADISGTTLHTTEYQIALAKKTELTGLYMSDGSPPLQPPLCSSNNNSIICQIFHREV